MSWSRETSLLSRVDRLFCAMEQGTRPLMIDGSELDGDVPSRPMTLRELRARMLDTPPRSALREMLWAELAFRAQGDGEDWRIGAVWMMTPGMRTAIRRILLRGEAPYADIEADVVEGFLTELKTVDVDAGGVATRLWWAGYRRGLQTRSSYRMGAVALSYEDWMDRRISPSPQGHPDQVLDRAVHGGAITAGEAELIGRTRIEGEGLAEAARRLSSGYLTCRARRTEAEERLAAYLLVPGSASTTSGPRGRAACGEVASAA